MSTILPSTITVGGNAGNLKVLGIASGAQTGDTFTTARNGVHEVAGSYEPSTFSATIGAVRDLPYPIPSTYTWNMSRSFVQFDSAGAPSPAVLANAYFQFTVSALTAPAGSVTLHAVIFNPPTGLMAGDVGDFDAAATTWDDIDTTSAGSVIISATGSTTIELSATALGLLQNAINADTDIAFAFRLADDLNNNQPTFADGPDGYTETAVITTSTLQLITEEVGVPETTFDWSDMILSGSDNTMEYSIDGGSTWTTCDTDTDLSAFAGSITSANDILVRYIGAGDYQTIDIVVPSATFSWVTYLFTGASTGMQFSLNGGVSWTTVPGDYDLTAYVSSITPQYGLRLRYINQTAEYQAVLSTAVWSTSGTYAYYLYGSDSTMQYSFDGVIYTTCTTNLNLGATYSPGQLSDFYVQYVGTGSGGGGVWTIKVSWYGSRST